MPKNIEMDHITIIVPEGKGKEVLQLAKKKGLANGTVSKGLGTANKELLKKVEDSEDKVKAKDIVSLVAATDLAEIFLKLVAEEFGFGKPGHGIGYAVNVNDVHAQGLDNMDRAEDATEVQVITAIIRHGDADKVMESAREAGARGGTLIENTDESNPELSLFSKGTVGNDEVVIILTKQESVAPIMDAIRQETGMDKTTGIMYVQNVHFAHGLKK